MLTFNGYTCAKLVAQHEKYILYRGYAHTEGPYVLIKALTSVSPHIDDITKLIHEYEISKGLVLDGILQSVGLEKQGAQLALIMEDFDGIPLTAYLQSKPVSTLVFFPIAIQLSRALSELHHHQLIHKDIHPGNILINPDTLKVKLCGLGLTTSLVLAHQAYEGTPAYMSPEQTGRMNRTVDYRSDLYSLGITLYEMLSGRVPFQAQDPIEWIHVHIAKEPIPIDIYNEKIPPLVSKIIMKLIAKNMEERYQSAYGLLVDLEACYKQWSETGSIASFALDHAGLIGNFDIPQKVYGRELETSQLLECFERFINLGNKAAVLITGHAGIGKTSLIKEIYKPIVEQKGYFISGKFVQLNRNIPYEPIIQAFRGLIGGILSEHSDKLVLWKEQLIQALGTNGAVIADVIPELRQIIGMIPPAEVLLPIESQNRLQLAFRQFVQVVASKEHPLVIFLDDIQWADPASLQLLEVIMTDPQIEYLFFIGAYRDHEVSNSHPTAIQMDKLLKSGLSVHTIQLSPVPLAELNRMVADTLYCEVQESWDLAAALFRKSSGNPFFFKLLFESTYKEQFLTFDACDHLWKWNMERIETIEHSDEMLEFIIDKIGRLPSSTQIVLSLAACLGNQFDLNIVAAMNEQDYFQAAADLKSAVMEGLILPLSEPASRLLESSIGMKASGYFLDQPLMYQFMHDRIQQAAYSIMDEEQRMQAHLKAGTYMREHADFMDSDTSSLEIANHYNQTIHSVVYVPPRELLLELNILAGRKAKASSAFEAASRYFQMAVHFIQEDAWSIKFEFCFEIFLEHLECLYLGGSSAAAELLVEAMLERARCRSERTQVRLIQLTHYVNIGRNANAITIGLESLQEYGIVIPRYPSTEAVIQEREAAQELIDQNIHMLSDLPEVTQPDILAAMNLMLTLVLPTLVSDKDVYTLLISKYMELSFEHGSCPAAPLAYGSYGIHTSFVLGKCNTGLQLAKAAYRLSEKYQIPSYQGKIHFMVGKVLNQWEDNEGHNQAYWMQAIQLSMNYGDFIYARLAMADHVNYTYTRKKLGELYDLVQSYLSTIAQTGNLLRIVTFYNYLQLISDLQGLTNDMITLDINQLNEHSSVINESGGTEFTALQSFRNYTYKTQIHYLLGNYSQAVQAAECAVAFIEYASFLAHLPEHHYYYSLAISAAWDTFTTVEKQQHWIKLEHYQSKMKQWAEVNPSYYMHKYKLITAEMARLSGDESTSITMYHESIVAARDGGYIQNEAIANELFAKLYLAKGIVKVARVYMTDAYEGYINWGALVKARDLLSKYPDLVSAKETIQPEFVMNMTLETKESSDSIDLASILKAAQSFSNEIDLEQLLFKLMGILIENAGAQRGCLLVSEGTSLLTKVYVQAGDSFHTSLESTPLDRCEYLPTAVISYVNQTLQVITLDDARMDVQFSDDIYIVKQQPRSILCLPIVKPGHPTLILYLENNLTTHAFTADRIDVLQMLSFQVYFVFTLLQSFGKTTIPIATTSPKIRASLVEPLTARELEVLNLVAKGMSNLEIGDQLGVVIGTVKNHIQNIYGKLDVNKRTKAVSQARELNLLNDPMQ
ncbi:Predicted ATPase [Paenibacillus sp. 1_12]|uniref:helix-turn-helix transcriptional regulator n=1 Tax=Paenibacillus sp. 1_12 TaxID=1566278 RepID=UPI0008EE1A10|nr:AAA family ATPase [Paenibacillus sp. 1_12]SFL12624.1 Predicted ATPase [Paenibacillus sp. 1_12]